MRSAWGVGTGLIGIATMAGLATAQAPMQPAPMADDAAFAEQLWQVLVDQRLVGEQAIAAVPYLREGSAHGATLVTFLSTIMLDGAETPVIVKRSYEGENATRGNIIASPTENLANITVMVKREAGYDAANQDWFYAMYMPDGSIGQMEGMTVAGRDEGCISCHATAPGGDYLFLRD